MPRITNIIPRERRFQVNRILLDSALGDVYMRARPAFKKYRVHQDARLVIDGFPRSANTYALFAAEDALGQGTVRGHTHAAATLHRAVAMNIPTILVIREPRAAVASLMQMASGMSAETGFSAYTRFHRKIEPLADRIVIADFNDVVHDFGAIMDEVNNKFSCSLPTYKIDEEAEQRIRDRVEAANAIRNGGTLREEGVARPSGQRRSPDEVLRTISPRAVELFSAAEGTYKYLARKL